MVRGWIAKSADWPRINRNYTPALDIQQCHYMCHSVPGCRSFSFEDETKSCLTFSGIASAPQAIRSPTLKSAIGVKSGKLEKWCSMNRPLILISEVFNGKIVYTNLNFITIENNSCDEVEPGEADGSVNVYIHHELDSTGTHVVVPCACDSSCGILETPLRAHMKSSKKPIFDCLLISKSLISSTDLSPILRVSVL